MTPQSPNRIERSIALIGYRGSGKTTVGRALAAQLAVPFVDTDDLIVEAAGKPISEIFADEGEERFRELEEKIIDGLRRTEPSILSVGGGAVINPDNVEVLRSVATVVWLTAPADVLADRIQGDSKSENSRPALTGERADEEVEEVLRERKPLYEAAADHIIDTQGRTVTGIAEAVVAELGI